MGSEVVCDSRIEGVTVYARGAVVRRRVGLPEEMPEAACEVVVPGVTAFADAGTMRAAVGGGREVLGVRARLVVPEKPAADGSLAGKVDALRRTHEALVAERNHAAWRRDVLASVQPEPDLVRRALAIDPADRVADALAVVRLAGDEMAALDARIAELSDAIEKVARDTEAARIAAAQASAADAAETAPARYAVVVQLGPAKDGARAESMEVEYAVPAARWWPAYRARFTDGATRVALTLSGLVAQASGEDWTGIALALSTGDLLRDARLPEMTSLRLGRAQRPRSKGYRAPPEGLDAMFDGYDRFVAEVRVTAIAVTTATVTVSTRGPITGAPPPWGAGGAAETTAAFGEYQAHDDEYDSPTTITPAEDVPRGKIDLKARLGSTVMARTADDMPRRQRPGAAGYAANMPAAAPSAAPMQQGRAEAPKAKGAFGLLSPRGGAPMAQPMPQAITAGGGAPEALAELDEGALGGLPPDALQMGAIEPADAWLDFDTLRLDAEAPRDRRGRLVREAGPFASGGAEALRRIRTMEAPAGTVDPQASRGLFDVVYTATGTADVPANGRPHRVAIVSAEAAAAARFVTVPREAPEVYRRAEAANPFGVPLLTGPVEVLIDGALVALTRLSYTDRGGQISIGLGVEERVRVARNARVEEGSAGLLGGTTTVDHAVTTELSSSLGRAIKVEIVDRLPVSDDKDVDIKLLSSQPQPSSYTQAELGQPVRKAFRWEVDVPAGGKAKAEWRYRVTLPSKMEVVGGNRRE